MYEFAIYMIARIVAALALWKVIDIIGWFCSHIKIGWV